MYSKFVELDGGTLFHCTATIVCEMVKLPFFPGGRVKNKITAATITSTPITMKGSIKPPAWNTNKFS